MRSDSEGQASIALFTLPQGLRYEWSVQYAQANVLQGHVMIYPLCHARLQLSLQLGENTEKETTMQDTVHTLTCLDERYDALCLWASQHIHPTWQAEKIQACLLAESKAFINQPDHHGSRPAISLYYEELDEQVDRLFSLIFTWHRFPHTTRHTADSALTSLALWYPSLRVSKASLSNKDMDASLKQARRLFHLSKDTHVAALRLRRLQNDKERFVAFCEQRLPQKEELLLLQELYGMASVDSTQKQEALRIADQLCTTLRLTTPQAYERYQRQLQCLAKVYPSLSVPPYSSTNKDAFQAAMCAFQRLLGLPVDGICHAQEEKLLAEMCEELGCSHQKQEMDT